MEIKGLIGRLLVFVLTIALVVGLVAGISYVYEQQTADRPSREPLPENTEFQPDRILPERVAASGSVTGIVQANRSYRGRQILIDMAHKNSVQREDIQALVTGLVRAGHEVQLLQDRSDLDQRLRNADAFVVIDPAQPYSHAEVTRVNTFTKRGGRLLLVGEPNVKKINIGLFGASISTQRSQLTELAASYGISFETEFVYNMNRNDGNYKHVFAHPGPHADLRGVNRTVVYTAAPVHVRIGKRLLVAAPGTEQLGVKESGPHPIAVEHGSRNVTAVGDASMLGPVRSAVADNEAFIAHLGTFLVSGSRHLPDANRTEMSANRSTASRNQTGQIPTPGDEKPPTPTPKPGTPTPTPTATPKPTQAYAR